MRATIRPFKIEFKKRFSRSSPKHSSTAENVGESPTTASFSNVGVFTAGRRRDADGFSDARKAADALFARSDSAAPPLETVPTTNAPAGRVLQSLVERSDVLTNRLTEADQKSSRSRVGEKTKAASSIRPKKRPPQKRSDTPERAVMKIEPKEQCASAPDHERRSIRKRRLLDAALKAGEKWKRRLCSAAR